MILNFLFNLLVAAAKISAVGALDAFSKGAGKSAFEALKHRLNSQHGAISLDMLAQADKDATIAAAVKSDLARPGVAQDAELLSLAETLRQEIVAFPREVQAQYAIDIEEIESGGKLLFDEIEGIKSTSVKSQGDMSFVNIKAPPGNG